MNVFGERCRQLRELRNLSQTDLCLRANLPNATVSVLENSHRYPHVRSLIRVCRALETSADFMLGLSDERFPMGPQTARLRTAFARLSARDQELIVRLCEMMADAQDQAASPGAPAPEPLRTILKAS